MNGGLGLELGEILGLVEGLVLPTKLNVTGDPPTLENDVGEFIIN